MSFNPQKIVQLRNLRNMTQQQLAKELGRSVNTISNWECGRALPNSDQLKNIADLFEVSADYLLDRNESADPDIRSIQRAMQSMDTTGKQKLKTMLQIAFDIDFSEE